MTGAVAEAKRSAAAGQLRVPTSGANFVKLNKNPVAMSVYKNSIVSLCCSCLMFLPSAGAALDLFSDEAVIWEAGRNVFVKYAERDDSRFGTNDHPVELNAKHIGQALSVLEFAEDQGSGSKKAKGPVFTDEQVRTLSENLAKGLGVAKPDQDIVFSLEKKSRRIFGLKGGRLFVAGRAFFKDGRLNLIIGEHDRRVDEGFEAAYDPTRVGIVAFSFDHGNRTAASGGFKQTVAEVPGVERKRVDNAYRNDWLVLDLQQASEGAALSARMRQEEELARKQQELRELQQRAETQRRRESAVSDPGPARTGAPAEVPAAAPPPAAASEPASAAIEAPARAQSSVEERLTILNQLRDKGLVTPEEYARKRREILDDL